jgi:hypothetical protein
MSIFASISVCIAEMLGLSQGIENRRPSPRETVDGGDIRVLAEDPEESWVAADESPRVEERSAHDNKILKEL